MVPVRSAMPTTTSMLSANSASRPVHDTSPRSPPGMSPAKKFRPLRCTPAFWMAATNASTSLSAGTASANGHQNSTASKPAAFAAAGRLSRGSSVRRMEQFTVYVIVGPSRQFLGPGVGFQITEENFLLMKSVGGVLPPGQPSGIPEPFERGGWFDTRPAGRMRAWRGIQRWSMHPAGTRMTGGGRWRWP